MLVPSVPSLGPPLAVALRLQVLADQVVAFAMAPAVPEWARRAAALTPCLNGAPPHPG
jgi:hypothetical protein